MFCSHHKYNRAGAFIAKTPLQYLNLDALCTLFRMNTNKRPPEYILRT